MNTHILHIHFSESTQGIRAQLRQPDNLRQYAILSNYTSSGGQSSDPY